MTDVPPAIRDAVALADGQRTMTHGDLGGAVAEDAAWLERHGGAVTGLLADNGCGWALADLALAQGTTAAVPLPGNFSPGQLRHVLADAGVDRLLTDDPDRARRLEPAFEVLGHAPVGGLTLLGRERPRVPAPMPTGTAKITYTSGSTGTPRGVCLPGAAMDAVVDSLVEPCRRLMLRRHLCLLPLPTLLENLAGLLRTLRSGGTCVLPALADVGMSYAGLDARRLAGALGEYAPESLILVPEMLQVLVTLCRQGWRPPGSLRFIAVGGARVSPALLGAAAAAGLPVYEGYGLSEASSVVCLNVPGAARQGTVGRPLPHARVRIAADGEIHVAGALMAGYLGSDAGPLAELATGDLGELDAEGYLHVKGRRRNVLITSLGRNVSPEWVEGELQAEPAIGRAVVVGEARPWLGALLWPAGAADAPALAAAVARANARLPDYARVRRWLVAEEALSVDAGTLTANGRPRRAAILGQWGGRIAGLYDEDESVDGARPAAAAN